MADKSIGELPQAPQVQSDSQIPLEQNGQAMRMTGEQFANFARESAAADVQRAVDAANSAGQSQVAAQTAADRAEAARESIVLDEQKMAQAVQEAEDAAQTAQNAASSAGASQTAAQQAQTAAESAQTAAQQAASDAQSAQTAAQTSATEAESSAVRAENAAGTVESIVAGNEAYTKRESDLRFAVPIVEVASGEVIAVTDSAELPLQGLRVFGKTIQDGTPAPDAPVELVSVGNGGAVTVNVVAYETDENPQTLTISTPNGLPGLPVTSGGNYTDENDQQWICDEVDFARGVYVQRITKVVYDGSEAWMVLTTNRFYLNCTGIVYPTSNDHLGNVMSDYFSVVSANELFNNTSVNGLALNTNANAVYLRVNTAFTTAEELKVWLAENPVTVQYILATPIETALSAEELAQYAALHTNYPNTTVLNDAGTGMEVKYAADTKMYIDNKFAQLAAAIVNNT